MIVRHIAIFVLVLICTAYNPAWGEGWGALNCSSGGCIDDEMLFSSKEAYEAAAACNAASSSNCSLKGGVAYKCNRGGYNLHTYIKVQSGEIYVLQGTEYDSNYVFECINSFNNKWRPIALRECKGGDTAYSAKTSVINGNTGYDYYPSGTGMCFEKSNNASQSTTAQASSTKTTTNNNSKKPSATFATTSTTTANTNKVTGGGTANAVAVNTGGATASAAPAETPKPPKCDDIKDGTQRAACNQCNDQHKTVANWSWDGDKLSGSCDCADTTKIWSVKDNQCIDRPQCTDSNQRKTVKCPEKLAGVDGVAECAALCNVDTGKYETDNGNIIISKCKSGYVGDGNPGTGYTKCVKNCDATMLARVNEWMRTYKNIETIVDNGRKIVDWCAHDMSHNDDELTEKYNAMEKLVGDTRGKLTSDANAATEQIQSAYKQITSMAGDFDRSVWRNANGEFNTSRLVSDTVAGVVLGTAGGIITSNIIKKNQLNNGYEDLQCTIGGQVVAGYDDTFDVGVR